MARRSRQPQPYRCRRCRLERTPEEFAWTRGLCPACLEVDRRLRRRKAGARILAKAKDLGTVERDGQTFRVVLPPKRRTGRKVR